VNSFQVGNFDGLDVDELIIMPKSDFSEARIPWSNTQGNGLMMRDAVDFKDDAIERYATVSISGSLKTEAEDVLGRLKWGANGERAEQGLKM